MTKLLPCPFCGGSATMEQTGDYRWSVGCDSADEPTCMGYQSFTTFARQGEASEAWNRRAAILPQRMRETAAEAIRTFCKSLGNNVVVVSSDDVERIYYSGISVDALSAAIAIAFSRPECGDAT